MIFVIMFFLWIVLAGGFNPTNVLLGLIISALITLFVTFFLKINPLLINRSSLKKLGSAIKYILFLLKEIVNANIGVLKVIYRKKQPDPVVVHFKSELKSETTQVLVANSITLTPGTITIDTSNGEYYVHALDKPMSDGLKDWYLFKNAKSLEG